MCLKINVKDPVERDILTLQGRERKRHVVVMSQGWGGMSGWNAEQASQERRRDNPARATGREKEMWTSAGAGRK